MDASSRESREEQNPTTDVPISRCGRLFILKLICFLFSHNEGQFLEVFVITMKLPFNHLTNQ